MIYIVKVAGYDEKLESNDINTVMSYIAKKLKEEAVGGLYVKSVLERDDKEEDKDRDGETKRGSR